MVKSISVIVCIAAALVAVLGPVALAQEKETGKQQAKKAWKKLFNYPANVTKDSAKVVADTGKKGADVVANTVKTTGQVTSGELEKTKDLVVEPLTGTAEAGKSAVENTAKIPIEAAKEQ
jgi:hypothetical protein